MKRSVVLLSGVLLLAASWMVVLEVGSPPNDSVSAMRPPTGFVIDPGEVERGALPLGAVSGTVNSFRPAGDPEAAVLELSIISYSSPWKERISTLRSARPSNVGDGRDSPKLEGIGLGSDTIEYGAHPLGEQPLCSTRVFWAHVGNQHVTATLWLSDTEPPMSPGEFRLMLLDAFDFEA